MIEDIDNYLTKNKKQFFAMMNSHWGKNDDDTKNLKFLWNKAQEAKGTNNKIKAFEDLKKAMKPFIHEDRLAKNEKILEDNNIDKFTDPSDQLTLEMDRMFSTLSNFPELNKLNNLKLDEAFSQGYDYDQMKELAKAYGYDYRNKDDRIEFLNNLNEYHKRKNVEKVWNEGGDAVYTNLVTPITKEYAQKNYENIDSFWDIAPALATDFAVNTSMAATPAKYGADIVAPPVIRGIANMAVNDRNLKDAAKEATSEGFTNIATPYALRLPFRGISWAENAFMKSTEKKLAGDAKPKAVDKAVQRIAKQNVNDAANKAAEIENKLKNGAMYKSPNSDKLYVFNNKEGTDIREVGAAEQVFRPLISENDYQFYLRNKNLLRGKNWGPKPTDNKSLLQQANVYSEDMANTFKSATKANVINKIKENIKNNKPATEGISANDLADFTGINNKETKWNWAKRTADNVKKSQIGEDLSSYLTNLQGRSKYGGRLINTVGQAIPGLEDKIDLTVHPKADTTDPELNLYKHLRELHDLYPNYYEKPKMPEKYKDMIDDITIKSIFGGE